MAKREQKKIDGSVARKEAKKNPKLEKPIEENSDDMYTSGDSGRSLLHHM